MSGDMVEEMGRSLIPPSGYPPVAAAAAAGGAGGGGGSCHPPQPVDQDKLMQKFQEEGASVPFALNRNLRVHVSLIKNCEKSTIHLNRDGIEPNWSEQT